MQNRYDDRCKNKYLKPFSVLTIKLVIKALFVSLLSFALIKVGGLGNGFTFSVLLGAAVLGFLVFCPLHYGSVLFFADRAFSGSSKVKRLFAFFSPKLFFSALKNGLLQSLYKALCFTAFFLPGISMALLMCYNIYYSVSVIFVFLSLAASLMLLISGALAFSKAGKLAFLFEYLFVLSPEKKAGESLQKSIELMKGKTLSVTALKFGNFLRVLLCTAIIPTGFVWNSCQQRKADLARDLFNKET